MFIIYDWIMLEDYRIHLNFLPITGEIPKFQIFRKLRAEPQEVKPALDDIHCYSLPKNEIEPENRVHYWVSYETQAGFEFQR